MKTQTQTHTPGPWAVDPVLRGGPWYRIESEHGPAIGWVAQVPHPNSGNAALIASAPEMLAMLKELQANHAWVDRGKLIAKAEGREKLPAEFGVCSDDDAPDEERDGTFGNAPELLEALQAIQAECEDSPDGLHEATLGVIAMKARAAIAKAEGGAE